MRYLIFILFPLIGFGQTKKVQRDIDIKVYVEAFKGFKVGNLLSNEVSIITPGVSWDKVKHSKKEAHKYLVNNYSDSTLITKYIESYNKGYMIVIGQFNKFEIIRYFTLHLSYLTGKIEVIEIEKIK